MKLISLCPIFSSEQREQREQTFKINNLQRERRKIKSEHHEQTFKIKDLTRFERGERRLGSVIYEARHSRIVKTKWTR